MKRKRRNTIFAVAGSLIVCIGIFLTGYALGCGVEYDRFTRLVFFELSKEFSQKSMERQFEVGPFRFERKTPYLYQVNIMRPSAEIAGAEAITRR